MEEEKNNEKNTQKYKILDYFNYETENLDLWTMENLLTYNNSLINYINTNFGDFDFSLWINWNNKNLVKDKKFDSISKDFFKDLPNTIWLIREKFRNADTHWWKTSKKEELEELREIMLYWEWLLIKISWIC